MDKILLPTDGSKHSLKAARYARKLLERSPLSSLTILHVSDIPKEVLAHGYMLEVTIDPQVIKDLTEEKTDQVINETKAVFKDGNFRIDILTQIGNPVQIICEMVEKEGYDLIIMGSRGLGEIKGLLLGSVSDRISHLAKCPVLIVK
ncbi:MAG: universal stress protein [Clostridia bacterium]|nr:universal stress protein [Clostridia bacterium]